MSLYGRTDSTANLNKVAATVGNGAGSVTETIVFVDEQEAQLAENKARGINGPGWWAYHTYSQGGVTRHKARMLCFLTNPDLNANETQSDDAIAADASSIINISVQPANQSTKTPEGAVDAFTWVPATTLAGEADAVYTGLIGTSDGFGTGATFTVTRDGTGAITTVTKTAAGSGYAQGDTITISGADIGGVDVTDDLTIGVSAIATAAATFSVTAADDPDLGDIVYQWQMQTATGTVWADISGATSSSLALTGLTTADSGKKYRVKLTSTAGATEVISGVATLTVIAA